MNKEGVNKKRVVYSFSQDITMVLKLLSYHLYRFDSMLSPNCYAFRQSKSAGAALRHILKHPKYRNMYCYKADIRDYFNSINEQLIIANYNDAMMIKDDLVKNGYLKLNQKKKKVKKKELLHLYQIKYKTHTVTFGKNNIQNETLTFHYAKNNYMTAGYARNRVVALFVYQEHFRLGTARCFDDFFIVNR